MTFVSIGMDATDIPRIAATMERYGIRFLERIFTDAERNYCMQRPHPAQHLAARFAAKEATMKALGTGHARGVHWRDIEVFRAAGPPQLRFSGGARRRLQSLRADRSLLTLTHSQTLAIAQVVLLGP